MAGLGGDSLYEKQKSNAALTKTFVLAFFPILFSQQSKYDSENYPKNNSHL